MTTFLDIVRKLETDAILRSSNVVKQDVPNCINCGFLHKDGLSTPKCRNCGMSSTVKFNRKNQS